MAHANKPQGTKTPIAAQAAAAKLAQANARMTAAGGRRVTAGDHGAEILAWEMHAGMTMLDVRGH